MKQVRHFRIVPTKKGRKRILINPDVRKKNKSQPAKIKTSERKIFKHMSDPKEHTKEFGGAIDFDLKGNVENINITPGSTYAVDLDPDYEVQYHTHPDKFVSPPTPDDIMALLGNNKQQAEIIFRNGESFTIIKTPKTKALSKLSTAKLYKILDKAFLKSHGKDWENKYRKELEKMGFIVFINRNVKSAINVGIQPIEPKPGRKK